MRNYYKPGSWNAVCDRCGLQFKSDCLKLEWTGLRVCRQCHETRHPQDLIRVPKEETVPPWSRPEPTDVFISLGVPITPENEIGWISTETSEFILTES
jgi:hypothetical protein